MKTRISSFCDEYGSILDPVDGFLMDAIGGVERESREDVLQMQLVQLADARHRFRSLQEKIEHQQAYLIIFGPLKSGKSTLMNAISGTYVSEVSSMPAYPCLVYASHGEETGFSAITYNGNREVFSDNEELQCVLDESHAHLAERIRMHEQKGEEFDPRVHYTEAIRRIDINVPVPALDEANTVLVDTPGLYSRMKFGYDLMTREFRDSAACAVFVVKSDNLFLEQVFEEFNQLLNIFSRIFLVVNMDTSKRDLKPDGSLGPSIESSDPQKIVEAFQSLSMSAPMREAFDSGRLMIYPIDLLNAAHANMGGGKSQEAEAATAENSANSTEATHEIATKDNDLSFDHFIGDLTEYLNSSEYLLEFERDSLVQGGTICGQIRSNCDLSKADEFQRQRKDLANIHDELTSLIATIDEVNNSDLKALFKGVRDRCLEATEVDALRTSDALRKQLGQSMNQWLENDESLHTLNLRCKGAINKAYEPLGSIIPQALVAGFDTYTGGAKLDRPMADKLHKIGIDLRATAIPLIDELRQILKPDENSLDLITEDITVRRSIFDWIMLRSLNKVRERVFGPADSPKNEIAPEVKKKRLVPQGSEDLSQMIDDFLATSFPEPQKRYVVAHADSYITKMVEAIKSQLEAIRAEKAEQLAGINERIAADQRVVEAFLKLDNDLAGLEERMEQLADNYLKQVEEPAKDAIEIETEEQPLVAENREEAPAEMSENPAEGDIENAENAADDDEMALAPEESFVIHTSN